MSANSIVTVNVTISGAPSPSTLQRTGAIVSCGSTNIAPGHYQLISEASDLADYSVTPASISGLTWASAVVTVTTSAPLPLNLPINATFPTTISGCTPAGYNGQFLATVTSADTFTYPLTANPGAATVEGQFTLADELAAQLNTFFAQGSQLAVYILELGVLNTGNAVIALKTFINDTPQFFYSYLVPRSWNSEPTLPAFLAGFAALNSKTYFFVTTTTGTYSVYTQKSTIALVEAPNLPLTEFSIASLFWRALSYNPSGTNRVTPFAFGFVYGVTQFPLFQNTSLLAQLKAAFINVIGTAAEGGLTNTMVSWGTTADGRDFSWWYSVDWAQINLDLNISNAIINGSNNPINPLYYDQNGINSLQDVAVATLQSAISFGMSIGAVIRTGLNASDFIVALDADTYTGNDVVNAIPFLAYVTANPSDYKAGAYNGLSAVYLPSRGFVSIIFNLNVTDFLTQ